MNFLDRYPHGVLTEQEGGVPNEVYNWEAARHVCRKHRITEDVCPDSNRILRRLRRSITTNRRGSAA